MKKRKALGIFLVGIAAIVLISAFLILSTGNNLTIATVFVVDSGTVYMDYYERPVQLRNVPKHLKTGDKYLIVFSATVADSFPEQTNAWITVKLKSGTEADISRGTREILNSLRIPNN